MFFNSVSKLSQKVRDNKDNQSAQSDQTLDTPLPEGRFARFFSKMKGQPASYANKQHYIFGKTLGAGAFGVVRQARNVQTSENVAIKILLKKALKGQELQMLYEELAILRKLDHPNIVKFKDWFESKDKFYIVTQLATGGELFDRILDKGKFTERDAAAIIIQLLQAVEYMHSQNVVHRDLKPENVLYLDQSDNSQLVISDFGIAKQLSGEDQLLHKAAGSMGYVAPEVLTTSGHGKPCDIWSLGVITYTLLSGYSPFIAESTEGFLEEVSRDEFPVVFHQPYWNNISIDAKEFILKALTLDPAARPSATELLKDKWLISTRTTGKDLLPAIREGFNASNKLRAVLHVVILDNRIKRLKQLYGVNADDNEEEEDDTDLDENSPDSCGRALGSLKDALRSISLKPQSECSVHEKRIKSELTQHAFAQLVLAAKGNKEKILKYQEQEGRTPSSPSSESK